MICISVSLSLVVRRKTLDTNTHSHTDICACIITHTHTHMHTHNFSSNVLSWETEYQCADISASGITIVAGTHTLKNIHCHTHTSTQFDAYCTLVSTNMCIQNNSFTHAHAHTHLFPSGYPNTSICWSICVWHCEHFLPRFLSSRQQRLLWWAWPCKLW